MFLGRRLEPSASIACGWVQQGFTLAVEVFVEADLTVEQAAIRHLNHHQCYRPHQDGGHPPWGRTRDDTNPTVSELTLDRHDYGSYTMSVAGMKSSDLAHGGCGTHRQMSAA